MNVQIEESWKQHLAPEFEKDYFVRLTNFVRQEYQTTTVYPPGRLIFNAFNLCPFDQVKVVIIGQSENNRKLFHEFSSITLDHTLCRQILS